MSSSLQNQNSIHCSNLEYLWVEIKKISDMPIVENKFISDLNKSKTWQNTLNKDKFILSLGKPDSVYKDVMNQFKKKYNVRLIKWDVKNNWILIPIVLENGKVTSKFLKYQFNGKYFEYVKSK